MEEEQTIETYEQLHELSCFNSEQEIEQFLLTLWKTRKTGLSPSDKSYFSSLLNLASPSQLDPVLACLRSLVRNYLRGDWNGDDLLKVFPPDLSIELQSNLVLLFQKHRDRWQDELFSDKRTSLRASVTAATPFESLPSSQPLSHHQNTPNNMSLVGDVEGSSAASIIDSNTVNFEDVAGSFDDRSMLPRLKSMTWSMEKGTSGRSYKVAVIVLKLQDYTKSTLGETEVKFQITRETLEAMLTSLTHISEKLSDVGKSSIQTQKRQRRTQHII